MENNLKFVYNKLQLIQSNHNAQAAWKIAVHYLDNHGIDDYFMYASGVTPGKDAINQCIDELDQLDEGYDRSILQKNLRNISLNPDALYEGDTGLDAYNRHPEAGLSLDSAVVPKASKDFIHYAFQQMEQSLIDFPERYEVHSNN